MISQPLSMLVLWLVFAVAAGIKFWGLAAQLRKCPEGTREALVNEGLTRPQRRNLMADEF